MTSFVAPLLLLVAFDPGRVSADQIVIPAQQSDDAQVEQLQTGPAQQAIAAPPVGQKVDKPAATAQLSGNLEARSDADAPEQGLREGEVDPGLLLYQRATDAWKIIRQRGQLPTPELMAREMGPEHLASFLERFRDAVLIFGKDSDTLPLPPPDPSTHVVDGGP